MDLLAQLSELAILTRRSLHGLVSSGACLLLSILHGSCVADVHHLCQKLSLNTFRESLFHLWPDLLHRLGDALLW